MTAKPDNDKIFSTSEIDIINIDRHSKEGRLKLRSYLAQRIERISLTFDAQILGEGAITGSGKIVARLSFP